MSIFKFNKKTTEIARSFSYKMSLPGYENRDFFCSQKAEVPQGKEEEVSEALYLFCKKEVIKSVNAYREEIKPKEKVEPIKTTQTYRAATTSEPELPQEVIPEEIK